MAFRSYYEARIGANYVQFNIGQQSWTTENVAEVTSCQVGGTTAVRPLHNICTVSSTVEEI